MHYSLTEAQTELRAQILKLCADFGDDYWLKIDQEARYPEEFYRAVAAAGWLGIAMPEEFGGAGLGISQEGSGSMSCHQKSKPFMPMTTSSHR